MKVAQIKYYIEILGVVEKRSTCSRLSVGSVLVKDDRIISTGWNGVAKGQEHCCEKFASHDKTSEDFKKIHGEFSQLNEIHAEQNCLGFAARNGIQTEDTTLFVTYSPCLACAKLIVSCGISTVYYKTVYERESEGIKFLENSRVIVKKIV